jgi:hypothetical protein
VHYINCFPIFHREDANQDGIDNMFIQFQYKEGVFSSDADTAILSFTFYLDMLILQNASSKIQHSGGYWKCGILNFAFFILQSIRKCLQVGEDK